MSERPVEPGAPGVTDGQDEVWQAVQDGLSKPQDTLEFEMAAARLRSLLYRMARRTRPHEDDFDDVVNMAALEVIRRRNEVRSSFRGFASAWLRAAWKSWDAFNRTPTTELDAALSVADESADVHEALLASEQANVRMAERRFLIGLWTRATEEQALTETQRVVLAHWLIGRSYTTILAENPDLHSVGNARVIGYRALDRLRKILLDRLFGIDWYVALVTSLGDSWKPDIKDENGDVALFVGRLLTRKVRTAEVVERQRLARGFFILTHWIAENGDNHRSLIWDRLLKAFELADAPT